MDVRVRLERFVMIGKGQGWRARSFEAGTEGVRVGRDGTGLLRRGGRGVDAGDWKVEVVFGWFGMRSQGTER